MKVITAEESPTRGRVSRSLMNQPFLKRLKNFFFFFWRSKLPAMTFVRTNRPPSERWAIAPSTTLYSAISPSEGTWKPTLPSAVSPLHTLTSIPNYVITFQLIFMIFISNFQFLTWNWCMKLIGAVSEQFQSSFRAVSEQFQSSFRVVSAQFQSVFRAFSEQFLEQFQSSFRAVSKQF